MTIQVTAILADLCALSILFLYFPLTLLFGSGEKRRLEGKGEVREGLKQKNRAPLWLFRAV